LLVIRKKTEGYMIDYYKKKSAEYYERARVALENNEEYERFINEAQTYDKRIEELESIE
jgi:hypothetical protein